MTDIAVEIYICVLTFVIGTVFGSFMNCLAWRYVHHESVLHGRSHCAVCGHTLSAADLVPVLSFLFLRGRCRYCHKKISPRYMAAEIVTGVSFVAIFLSFGLDFETVRFLALTCVLVGLSLIDFDIYEIPNGFIIAALIIWAATVPLVSEPWTQQLASGGIGGVVIAGAMLLISLLFDRVTGKESLGGGDIKLFFIAGLYLGLPCGLLCIIVSCLVGLLMAVIMKKQRIPFGPAISISIIICAVFGRYVVSWYMSLF